MNDDQLHARSDSLDAEMTLPRMSIETRSLTVIPSSNSSGNGDWGSFPSVVVLEADPNSNTIPHRLVSVSFTGTNTSIFTRAQHYLNISGDYGMTVPWFSDDPLWKGDDDPYSGKDYSASAGLVIGILINGLCLLLLCTLLCLRRRYTLKPPRHDEDSEPDGHVDELTDNNDGTRKDKEKETNDTVEATSQKQPENDDDEIQVHIVVPGKMAEEEDNRGHAKANSANAKNNVGAATLHNDHQIATSVKSKSQGATDAIPCRPWLCQSLLR
ncbi:hypothetical protein BGW41_003204 [Actinomortierella wolfii]|nr:hypothetical protein BGW41_003204 [Actinomortierella wolfii]